MVAEGQGASQVGGEDHSHTSSDDPLAWLKESIPGLHEISQTKIFCYFYEQLIHSEMSKKITFPR